MQKTERKASILIWSIFLSLIISISFLSISTKITSVIKKNISYKDFLEESFLIKEKIIKSELDEEIISNKTIGIENKIIKKSLKSQEIYEIEFQKDSNINLEIINSWIMFYYTGSNDKHLLTWSIEDIAINSWEKLKLQNLSWYTKFILESDNKFDIDWKRYKITEDIWNKKIIKTRGLVD